MELILTEAEKKAATWLELDDESVGKLVKATALKIAEKGGEEGKIWSWSAALILCSMASDSNCDTFTQTIEGLTSKGKSCGDWEIRIRKVKS